MFRRAMLIPLTIVVVAGGSSVRAAQAITGQPGACDAAKSKSAVETCRGELEMTAASEASGSSIARRQALERAGRHFRAAAKASDGPARLAILKRLRTVLGPLYLSDATALEGVVRELLTTSPFDQELLFELARIQEENGNVDGAEATLLDSRRSDPTGVEPNRKLAQFYSRRVNALQTDRDTIADDERTAPGAADKNGVYRVGRSIVPPKRLTRSLPTYPRAALEAGVEGVVTVDVIIDSAGGVAEAKVRRSAPLLDDAALQAVRHWQYAPTLVDGKPVSVKMTVVVPFQRPRP